MFQSSSRYPLNNLQCPMLKEALSRELVTPVVRRGDVTRTFRIIWREMGDSLMAAWDSIALQRRRCDAVVRALPNVEFYVSSITGVFTKGSWKGFKPSAIFPAISYWMVTTPDVDIGDVRAQVMRRLQDVNARAQFKPITAQRRLPSDTVADLSAPLYVVLKDHNSGYIHRRLEHSLNVLSDISEAHAPSRIVVLPNSKYRNHLTNAVSTLLHAGLCTDFHIAEEIQIDN